MNQIQRSVKSYLPVLQATGAGVVVGGVGLWAWRSREKDVDNDELKMAEPSALPTRRGPMVAVYLDEKSVEKLHEEYPGTDRSRLRKVVVQYNPSDVQRRMYESHFGGLATVKLTGEASSADRRALMASVSHAGKAVEPQSLSCAIDITPGELGGGPLGSAALIEQIKQAGAANDVSWKGVLPALSAHDRQFPSEEGGYDKLDEALTLTGSICRADWVDGTTGRCRTLTEEGQKRTDGWSPQGCIMCNMLEASPCRDFYKRFDLLSNAITKFDPPKENTEEDETPGNLTDDDAQDAAEESGIRGKEMPAVTQGGNDGGELSALDSEGRDAGIVVADGARSVVEDTQESEDDTPAAAAVEGKEEILRREELELLLAERDDAVADFSACLKFYNVFGDWDADDGMQLDLGGDGDGDTDESGEGSTEISETSSASEVAVERRTADRQAEDSTKE